MKKNILLVCPYIYHGGAEKQFRKLVDITLSKDDNVTILCMSSIDPNDKWISDIVAKGAEIIDFGLDPQKKSQIEIIFCNLKIFKKLCYRRFDYMYLYTLYFFPLIILSRLFSSRVYFSERILSPQTLNRKWLYKTIDCFTNKIIVNGDSLFDYFKSINCNVQLN